jgi:hypothetical protein
MYESDFQSDWTAWLRDRWTRGSAAFELKLVRCRVAGRRVSMRGGEIVEKGEIAGALPYVAVEPHQVEGLLRCLEGGKAGGDGMRREILIHKLSDMSADSKPFDCFVLSGSGAYIVVKYWLPGDRRGRAGVYMLTVGDFVAEVARGRKLGKCALTLARMKEIGEKVEGV